MRLISWNPSKEIEAYTITKDFGDMSFQNPDQELILNNRLDLANYLETSLENFVALKQIHSSNFVEVTSEDAGLGAFSREDAIEESDAMYTRAENLFLMTFHADCTPILLYCPNQKIVACIHAGWLGTTREITKKVVTHLIEKEGCIPKEMLAYIGPCISYEKLEVQQDVIDKINAMSFDTTPFYHPTDEIHYLVDNKSLNKQQLLLSGLLEENITVNDLCTIKNNDLFYSHRCKETGRSITIIKRNKE
ncbi:peptidoglycan editing factor PgeF [Tannockella kyphosi]|uniref:peptidoglycan editing factor PgeF n=1 Tax=Tannockella kyphosi TaxID=2899121 RepID=UPI0020110F33|nr:peptidoglycan editing factor PgeF [Tannockella kyphosi]